MQLPSQVFLKSTHTPWLSGSVGWSTAHCTDMLWVWFWSAHIPIGGHSRGNLSIFLSLSLSFFLSLSLSVFKINKNMSSVRIFKKFKIHAFHSTFSPSYRKMEKGARDGVKHLWLCEWGLHPKARKTMRLKSESLENYGNTGVWYSLYCPSPNP